MLQTKPKANWAVIVPLLALACFLTVLAFNQDVLHTAFLASADLQSFKTMFISIILEALPFVLLGVFLSSAIHVFVSEQTIAKLIPRNPIVGTLIAGLLGIIFPVCECGMIPVVRRLMRKGMPIYMATVFILSGPVINPVVFASTFMAFRSKPEMAYSRMALAFVVAVTIGLLIYWLVKGNPLRDLKKGTAADHEHTHGNKLTAMLGHASDEFFEMGKYLIFGAFITALIQITVSRETMVSIGEGDLISHLFMMGFAYVLSICSTSDAFIASSFTGVFSSGSLLTFLVFGAMLDFKTTLMLLSAFKSRFVLLLSVLLIVVALAGALLFEKFILNG